jgi:hypothetical protein
MTEDRILDRVRKLLAKAEGTTNQHEADAFMLKAQELIATHRLDEAAVWADLGVQERQHPHIRRISMPGQVNLVKAKRGLLATVGQANNCTVVQHRGADHMSVAGMPSDTEVVELLYTSLLLQMERGLHRSRKAPGVNLTVHKNNFAWGFVEGLSQVLAEANERVADHGSTSQALDLWTGEVDDFVASQWGRLRSAPRGKRRQYDSNARGQGHTAGRNADINRPAAGSGTRGELN